MEQNQLTGRDRPKDPYMTQKIMSATPNQLVSYIYDAILAACGQKDRLRAQRGLLGLIKSLRFEYEEIASPMMKLYRYCLKQVRAGEFDEVAKLIGECRLAWVDAMKLN